MLKNSFSIFGSKFCRICDRFLSRPTLLKVRASFFTGTLPNSDKEQQTRLYEKPAASSAIFVKDYRILLTGLLLLLAIAVYGNISAIFFTNLRPILSDWTFIYFYETEEHYDVGIYFMQVHVL